MAMANVYVGLSGGVDSAVSAALLKQAGHSVTGVFIKIWQPEFIECTWREDRLDAMRVAAHVGIPFREIDLSAEYEHEVVQGMLADYSAGITPNPDVLCNSKIKFGAFAKWARTEGADKIAMGHYARIIESGDVCELHRGKDIAKDQSYFLYRLSAADLRYACFPVGDMEKSEVRTVAARFGLPVAQKRDSQGLCFIGEVSMKDFLSRFITVEKGHVLDTGGHVIGEHDGAALYTVGQRHGFQISHGDSAHMYVIAIDTRANTITVSARREDAARTTVSLENLHWIHTARADEPLEAQARYHETPIGAEVHTDGNARVTFTSPRIIAPGQSLVLYSGDECVGGGIIAGSH